MKTLKTNSEKISLKEYINRMLYAFQPVAQKNRSFIFNEVRTDININTDPGMFSTIINGLLSSILGQSYNSCIRLSAETQNNVVQLQIRSNSGIDVFHPTHNIKEISPLVAMLGGSISLNNSKQQGSSIIFSFLRFPQVA